MKKDKIEKEFTEYDNCLNVKQEIKESSLVDFFDLDEQEKEMLMADEKEWKKHWVGMPEFTQEDNPPYKKIIVSFRNKEDYQEFAKIMNQKLTEKTKSIWYPELDREENALLRWMEDDES